MQKSRIVTLLASAVIVGYTVICLIHPSAAEPVAKGYSILLGLVIGVF